MTVLLAEQAVPLGELLKGFNNLNVVGNIEPTKKFNYHFSSLYYDCCCFNQCGLCVCLTAFKFVSPWVWESSPNLTIESPINGTYTGKITLNFTIEKSSYWFNNESKYWITSAVEQTLKSVTYVLDGNSTALSVDSNLYVPYKGSIELTNLTDGAHQLIVYLNATGVYRSFRGYYAQTQINDSNKTAIVFTFIPTPSRTPTITSINQAVQSYYVGIIVIVVMALLIIGCLLAFRRHRKPASLNKYI